MNRTLIAFIGKFEHARHLPVTGQLGSDLLVFFDYRMPYAERIRHTIELCRAHGIDNVARVVSGTPERCEDGVHDWLIPPCEKIDTVTCRACGVIATFPQVTRIDTVLAAV